MKGVQVFCCKQSIRDASEVEPQTVALVPTDLNCADNATRGLRARELTMDHCWFSGPEFLYKNKDDWPHRKRIKKEHSES